MCAKLRNIVAVFCVLVTVSGFQQQYFKVVPRSQRVQEGQEAVLECSVANLAGQVQWAKDGFALGFSSVIPGYPRYTMFGDRRHGVYNLRIVNVTLEDDAEFQCQVGPAQMHKVIRANASLTVISPPNAVEITNHPANSKIELKEGDDVSLECLVKNAKPAARIVWYRGNVELKGDKVSKEEIKDVESQNSNPKAMRYTTVSRARFFGTVDAIDTLLDDVALKLYNKEKIPGTDIVIEKGTPIFISLHGLHSDPDYFDDPEKYNPERFSNDRNISPAFFPFGTGPRKCVGMQTGLLHVKVVLAMILSHYEVYQELDELNVLDSRSTFTAAANGIHIEFKKLNV